MTAAATPTIRPFQREDADGVAAALVDSATHHETLEPERYGPLDPATVARRYRQGEQHPTDVAADERATLVAELDGEVVGMIDIRITVPGGSHRRLRYGYVAELAVRTMYRSRGVGAALLRGAEDWARRAGCTYTVLDYNARNVDAGRFYKERMGYRPAGMIVVKDLRTEPTELTEPTAATASTDSTARRSR